MTRRSPAGWLDPPNGLRTKGREDTLENRGDLLSRHKKQSGDLDEELVREAVSSQQGEILELLNDLVVVDSHSSHLDGVASAAEIVDRYVSRHLGPVSAQVDNQARIRTYEHKVNDEAPILLAGHLDTLFTGDQAGTALVENGSLLCGPGVADMKGGIAVMLGAISVLDRIGRLSEIPFVMALNEDEEIGSIHSSATLRELARNSRLGLVFEAGGEGGSIVTSRRGLRRYRLKIMGASQPSGFQDQPKQSAIVELAHQVLRLEALNNRKVGLSVNVGKVIGGTAGNVIPGLAEAELEVRYWGEEMGNSAAERIMASLLAPKTVGLELKLERTHSRPTMPRTGGVLKLFKEVTGIAARLGTPLEEEARSDASDANSLAAAGLPTLDGLGPVGVGEPSTLECVLRDSIFQRIELLVHLLWGLRRWSI